MTCNTSMDAIKELVKQGIEFVDICELPIFNRDRFTGEPKKISMHIYFMNAENQDVAYYTPCIKSLMIHKTPREWGEKAILDGEFWGRERVARNIGIYKEDITYNKGGNQ